MVGFDVTYDGARAPGAFSHHYRWKPAIVHGAKGGCQRGAGFTRYLPGIRLMEAGKKTRGARGGHSPSRAGWEMAKIMLGEGAAECRLRRDLLRQRALRLPTAAGGAIRASAHRHRHAGDGWDRIGTPRQRA